MKLFSLVFGPKLAVLLVVCFLFPAALMADEGDDIDLGWPRKIEAEAGTITIYQPQIEKFEGNSLEARAALSVTTADHPEPVFGAAWFDCIVSTDMDARTVLLLDLTVPVAKFPDAKEEHIDRLKEIIEEEIPKWEMLMSLDQILVDLDMSVGEDALASQFNNSPPEIIYKTTPAVLIMIDGDPILKEIEGENYKYVVNTPFFIVQDPKDGQYYLKGGQMWFSSNDILTGWEYSDKVPGKIVKLADNVTNDSSGEELADDSDVLGPEVPEIIVRTMPAELILTNGDADFAAIQGTSLLYLKNTDSDILMDITTQQYYVLISGRWYTTKSMTSGPWEFVAPDAVPEDFSIIPIDADISNVRASVAGTEESREAVVENSIPQTATVDRASATVEVEYDGQPRFEDIEGTSMQYAVNTDKSVLKIDGKYYCVDDGVWFESGNATGPWQVSTVVPDPVQEIPPESPVYNVKYVYIYDYTPEVVYVGYTPGYVNSYVYGGCVYYGTGWYYRPWYGHYYYPRPVTYGFGVSWNPYTGWGFSFGVSVGGPVGWFSVGWHSHRYGYWGAAGYRYGYHHGYRRGYAQGYNRGYYQGVKNGSRPPRSNNPSTLPAKNNIYSNRKNGVAQTGGTKYNPRNMDRISTDKGVTDRSRPAKSNTDRNNVFTDRNGNVYRNEGGKWQERENNRWKDAPNTGARDMQTRDRQVQDRNTGQRQNPSTRTQQPRTNDLNRDLNQRNRGTQRTQQYQNNRSNYQYSRPSGTRSSGSRPSSGATRSGTRRR